MTTDELERDLKTLAERRRHDEHLRRAIRATLGEQLQARPSDPRRACLALGASAVAAATLAVVLVALIGVGGSGGPSSADAAILAHVVRANTPPANIIVHVKETGVQDGTQVGVEFWQETNPPYAMRMIKGTAGEDVESAADGTTFSQYDPDTNTVYQRPDSRPPTLIDPLETLRAGLASGTAQIAGTVTIDGRSLYKLELPNGVVGYFDKMDYRPVYVDNPQHGGSVVRTQVVTYEELPITSQNDTLLSVAAQHAAARVAVGSAPAPTGQPTERK
jgi:hypothetical protein